MSNKITLATIQFRADTKGVNPALDAMRQSAKDAHDEMDRMQEALDKGIKKMKDANGVEFDVADKFRQAQKAAKSYDQALRELVKGATALETVVQNIRLGEIEKSSRAELKGAINAAEARKRSVRETDPEDLQQQRELNQVIEESRKQLNNLDRDTQKVIETLDKGGVVAQATLDKEIKGLKEILTLIPKGTDEWNKYNQQLTQMEALIAGIKRHDFAEQAKILGDIDLGKYKETDIRSAIDAGRELIKTYTTGSDEAKMLAQYIVRAEEHLKNYGVEAERSARREIAAQEEAKRKIQEKLDMMTGRMADVSKLTDAALQETKKFWEEQHAGAERGSKEALEYEKHIKTITDEQERIANSRRAEKANGLLGDLNAMSEKEIREAIEAARQLQQSLSVNDKLYQQFSVAIVNAEEHVKKYGIEAERAARKEAAAQEEAARKLKEKQDQMLLRMQNLGQLTREGLEETKKFWEAQLVGAKRGSDEAMRYETFIKTITAEQEHLSRLQAKQGAEKLLNADVTMSEGEMRKAIDDAKKYLQTLSLTDDEYKNIAGAIAGAEEYIKRFGLEAERSAMQASIKMDDMNKRMADISKLSDAALQETKKFWEEQFAGAERGSSEAKKYEDNIKAIAKEQERIAAERTKTTAQSIYGNLDNMSEGEIRRAIEAAKQYQQTLSVTDSEYKRMSQTILDAEEYIKNYGIEAERAARKEAEAQAETNRKLQEKMDLMTTRMSDVTRLTDQALQETKKYWEAQLAGVERNSDAAKVYEGHIRTITDEQTRLINEQNRLSSQKLFGNLDSLSEGEIRKSIEAAKQYQQTLSVTDDEYHNLSRAILDAEEHVKKYGIEGERAARREIEAMEKAARKREETEAMMSNQLRQGTSLTKEALKTQEQFWRKAIDDPKNAGQNVEWYKDRLQEVKDIQQQLIMEEGRNALDWFTSGQNADATGDEIKKRADALKAYKGTLRQTTDASDIAEIDRILESLAKKADAAKGELMSLAEALEIVDKIDFDQDGKLLFEGTTEQIIGAKNALEKELAVVQRGSDRYNELREKVDKLNDAINETRINQAQVDAILASPKTASYDQLKMAIDASRKKLNSMRHDTKEQQKEFEELANKVKEADYQMKQLAASSKGTASAWEKAFNRLKTYVVMYMGFNTAWQKVSATATDLMDLSDRMGEVRKTTGFTADEVGRLSENLKKMDVRTSLTSLMEISASAGQLGLKTLEDVQGFTEAANKLMIALPEMGREAATEMMRVAIATGEVDKIRKQLQEGTVEGSSATAVAMEKIASTIDRLRASSASTAPEITDFVKRVGAVGAQSGITIDQVAALGSTVSSLGMRIEMSATALSRMIPAIRNNAFELAKAIGVTPDTIRNLFDTGRGMEVILMILQRIKDTGMDADSVEQMLGMAGMRDIMKDLNQQGARAGIVFSGLSQNVDELRRQLGVASEAYEENIAIQQEFDKMNETTAAKWERLKNQFEEMFVGDEAQQWLGKIIDGARAAVDIIEALQGYIVRIAAAFALWKTGVGGAIWTYLINPIRLALTGVHSLNFQVKGLAATWRTAWKSMDAATKTNWIVALGSAIFMLGKYIYDTANRVSELDQALNELQHEESNNEHILNRLVTAFNNVSAKAAEATKKHDELEKKTKELNDEVDQLKKSTDLSTEATETLKKKEEELKKTKEELNKATDEMNKANNARLDLIKQINDKYSTYLGYMLSEKTAAEEVATAHQVIISALKEEMAQKRMLRSQEAIENEFGEDITEWRQNSREELNSGVLKGHKDLQQQVMEQWENVMARISYDTEKGVFTIPAIEGINGQAITKKTVEELRPIMQQLLSNTMTKVAKDAGVDRSFYFGQAGTATDKAQTSWGGTYGSWSTDDGFARWTEATLLREQRIQEQHAIDNAGLEGAHTQTVEDTKANMNQNRDNLLDLVESNQTFTEEQIRKMAQNVNAVVAGFNKYGKDLEERSFELVFGKDKEATLENAVTTMLAGVGEDVRKRVLKTAKAAATSPNGTGSVNTTTTNPWGTPERAESTTYTEMTAEQLVNRREQMNKFVNSLQTDTDVKAVLNEDKALKKAIEAGMSSDMRTVIEWYNAERLKIQDELHARHLTNTGDWLDPKKERGAKKQFRDEMDAYLHELDAYYTERKTRIEEAGTDEGLTEAEIRNRTLANEMEWQQRRAELQKLYSRKQKEVTQDELDAIYHIISERTGDTESFVKAQIAKTNQFVDAIEKSGDKGAAIVHRWMSQVELDTERSYLKGQQALTKQMKAIEDIIDKERPFNGITKQLRESLATMDILTGDMRKGYDELMKAGKDMRDFNERQGREELRRTSFLLGEAEQAYSTTIDRVMQQMREKGMGQWADWLAIRPEQQEALMAQLRQTYDSIQDAIKKEASQLKKQAEIMWNNILVPGGDGKTTMKQMLDRTVAQLGIDQGRVSRANSLIGAGVASDRVADKLAIQQMRLQLTMQEHYYNLMKKQGRAHVDMLNQQAEAAKKRGDAEEATRKTLDAQHAEMALNLATAKEETELAKQREEIVARTEESQNRLYTELREWADLLTSSLQGVMEAYQAGDAEYYNELAKLDLTGKGGPGAGTYVVIDDAGTSDAKAHYEYLDERQALERQHEIEVQNAQAEAWRKLMDDLNMKMSEQITDWMNAYLQNKATEDNTAELQRLQQKLQDEQQKLDASITATDANTQAVQGLTQKLSEGITVKQDNTQQGTTGGSDFSADKQAGYPSAPQEAPSNVDFASDKRAGYPGVQPDTANTVATDANTQAVQGLTQVMMQQTGFGADKAAGYPSGDMPSVDGGSFDTTDFGASKQAGYPSGGGELSPAAQQQINEQNAVTENFISNKQKEVQTEQQTDKKIATGAQSAFAKMTMAANLYGIAYQAMSNDNLSTTQKFQMMAVQAAGNAAISMLTTEMASASAKAATDTPGVLGTLWKQLGWAAAPVFAIFTGLLGGLMGLATSKIGKAKSEIAQATGTSASAGRLATGMLTYAEGNVNELTDPASLTPGRQYNVDGADGKTYRARYMGKGAKTHITNGPEFHLVGEAGREAIIDAKTTRLLQMNETGIWRDIQTLYNGGSISGMSTRRRRGRGVAAFADGNIGEFEDAMGGDNIAANGTGGMSIEMLASLQASIDRQSDLLENALVNGIKAVNKWTGSDGIPAMYNKMQKEAQRHGEKYL